MKVDVLQRLLELKQQIQREPSKAHTPDESSAIALESLWWKNPSLKAGMCDLDA